jgi:hypothetical protein
MNQSGSLVAAALLVVSLAHAGPASAQPSAATAAPVKELVGLLAAKATGAGPRFIAAEDPTDPARFVAAMLLPDLQLLLVSAAYQAPVLLRERVLTRKYQDAYQDLQAASVPAGKVVIEDLLANGIAIKPAKGQGPDAATVGGRTVTFDGLWRKAKISEADYTTAFTTAEQQYTRLLALLIAQAKAN